jgi:hypothetical protein
MLGPISWLDPNPHEGVFGRQASPQERAKPPNMAAPYISNKGKSARVLAVSCCCSAQSDARAAVRT